jgi:uncharacterized protein
MRTRSTQAGPVQLLVAQPTPFCNIDCSYCYLPGRGDRRVMGLDTVRLMAERVVRGGWLAREATVVWHAGEPLVVPPDWYAAAFDLLRAHCPPGVRLAHAVQTNGTLIDARWAALFGAHDVRVGVSIDGPRDLHDRHRRTRSGRGTFDLALRGIRRLREAGLPFHVITVLTRAALTRPDDLYDFYAEEGIERICFNVEEIEGVNGASSLAAAESEALYREFLARFIARARTAERRAPWVREIASSVGAILMPHGEAMPNPQAEPLAILTVDVEGNLSTFSPELIGTRAPAYGDFRFGNLRDGGPEALLASPAFLRAQAQIAAGVERCRATCGWFRWCGGGAPANKLFENGSLASGETMYCRLTKKATLDVVLAAVEAGSLPAMGAGERPATEVQHEPA